MIDWIDLQVHALVSLLPYTSTATVRVDAAVSDYVTHHLRPESMQVDLHNRTVPWTGWPTDGNQEWVVSVREIFIVHVGGTRCVTSRTDNIMKIHARITLTVEFIRGYIFLFLFYV